MYKLVIQDDEGKTTVVPLIRDEITIGRKEGNTIRLTERNVSRKHARIMRSNGAVAIEDLGSYNGVRVNGTRISARTPLTISDRVQIGDYLIELKAEGAETAAGAPVSYDDAKTQPVERIDPNYGQRGPTSPMAATPPAMAQVVTPTGAPPPGSPAHTMVALGDTDPGLQQGRAAVVAGAATSGHARLVVLSSTFAGREFDLSKPQIVIGRTDDNDVVVNHRSISRNHAKIIREAETGRYTIMDLQSSNGVRVNGEEYGKVELRRGDIVDLGHVRMRFVEAGEDFLFGRDAVAVDMPSGGNKGLIFGLVGLLLVGGVVGVVVATRGGGDKGKAGTQVASGSADGTGGGTATPAMAMADSAQPEMASIDAGAGAGAAASDSKALNDAKMAVQKAMDDEKWPAVIQHCKEVLAIVVDDQECTDKIEVAKREQDAQLKYDDFVTAVQKKDYAKVARLFGEIDGDSIYKEKAREAHDRMRDEYVGAVRGRAAGLAKQSKCKDIDRLAEQASNLWPEAGDAARAEGEKCQTAVATVEPKDKTPKDKTPKDKTGSGSGSSGGSSSGGGSSSSSGKTVQQLVDDANAAARNGQYGKALRSAEDALKQDSGNSQALTAAAIAACNLKDTSKAKKYIGKLSGQRQGMVRQVCLRNNVNVD